MQESSITRKGVKNLDDFLTDLSEEVAPSEEFKSRANRVMEDICSKLKVCVVTDRKVR